MTWFCSVFRDLRGKLHYVKGLTTSYILNSVFDVLKSTLTLDLIAV